MHFIEDAAFSESLDFLGLDKESAGCLKVEIEERCRSRMAQAKRNYEAMVRFDWGCYHLMAWYIASGEDVTLTFLCHDPAGEKV